MNKIEKYTSLTGEFLLPLLGFWFFDWNFFFILLFILLDKLSKLFFLKSKLDNDTLPIKQLLLISWLVIIFECLIVYFLLIISQSNFNLIVSLKEFWSYEEMGIQQGPILIPFLLLTEWLNYKREIKKKGNHIVSMALIFILQSVLRSIFLLVLIGVSVIFSMNESLLVYLYLGFYLFIILLNYQLIPFYRNNIKKVSEP